MSPFQASRLSILLTSLVALCALEEGRASSKAPARQMVALHPFAEPDAAADVDFQRPDHLPSPLDNVVCAYPAVMLEMGVSGEVKLSFIVAHDGSVRDVRVINSTDISFADAAKQGVLRQRYSPATAGGQPIDCRVHLAISFTATPGSQIRAEHTN